MSYNLRGFSKPMSLTVKYIKNKLDSSFSLRRIILILIDLILINLSLLICLWFSGKLVSGEYEFFKWITYSINIISIPLFLLTGHYRGLTRYTGSSFIYKLSIRNIILLLLVFIIGNTVGFKLLSIKDFLLLWIIHTGFTSIIRVFLRDLLTNYFVNYKRQKKIKVIIYGAGAAGAQLAASLRLEGSHQIIAFIDDEPQLNGRNLNGIKIFNSSAISFLKDEADQVLLAIPSLNKIRKRKIIKNIQKHSIPLMTIPSINDMAAGRAEINTLKPIRIEDILGRDVISPDTELVKAGIDNKVICITGAGGSIGSELCNEIIKLSPKKVILLERNEPSLYKIEQELLEILPDHIKLKCFLGSACKSSLINKIFKEENIDIIFHAAAYKHVPLVEVNPIEAIENNINSTWELCKAARDFAIDQMVLISTDKAVRPTNVMGATKRLSELIVQSFAEESLEKSKDNQPKTLFTMVRFGNVLGSSGSVVPLFQKQIISGGPITLTHPEIIRYFMTIEEAAQLVLQTTILATGGDVFLLDMGDPIKILDLAKQMIKLSGLTIKSKENPEAEIEIITTGLRPGEKLFEELLIDSQSKPTKHPLIFKAKEEMINYKKLWPMLDILRESLIHQESNEILCLLQKLVPEWKRIK